MYEIMWNVTEFSNRNMWPTDGRRPFVYAMGLGYVSTHHNCVLKRGIDILTGRIANRGSAAHGDYVFGWEGDSLQKAMDNGCNLNQNCPAAGLTVAQPNVYNNCKVNQAAPEQVDGCEYLCHLSQDTAGEVLLTRPRRARLSSAWCPIGGKKPSHRLDFTLIWLRDILLLGQN